MKKIKKIKRKSNNKFRKKIKKLILSILICILMIIKIFDILYATNLETYTARSGNINIVQSGEGIIIRNEKVYFSKSEGIINYHVKESQKVPKDYKIATIYNENKEDLVMEIKKIDKKIKLITEENIANNLFKDDLTKNDLIIQNLINEIRSEINKNNFKKVIDIKNQINNSLRKNSIMKGETNHIKDSLEDLIERRDYLSDLLNNTNNEYFNLEAGLFTTKIDGLEKVYNLYGIINEKLDDISFNIEGREFYLKDNSKVKIGQPIFKICKNDKWYLISKIENESILPLKVGKNFYIRIDGGDKLKGKLINIKRDEGSLIIVFEFRSHLFKYLDKRYVNIEIIVESPKGLKIPKKAITYRNGVKGVYIRNINNLIIFRPIKIIQENEEFSIIEESINGKIKIKINNVEKTVKSVQRYDEIIIKHNKIKNSLVIG